MTVIFAKCFESNFKIQPFWNKDLRERGRKRERERERGREREREKEREKEESLLGNGGIRLGINYSVSNKMKRDE